MPRGGARPGAGRKKKPTIPVKRANAEFILARVNEAALWEELLTATRLTKIIMLNGESNVEQVTVPDYEIRFKALSYLTNRRDGMPAQSVQESGTLKVTIEHIGAGASRSAPAETK